MPSDRTGVPGKITDSLNEIIETKEKMVTAMTDVSGVVGGWATIFSAVNTLIDELVRVIGAVAKGDL